MMENSSPERALGVVIKSPWIELILSGKKSWEIRGRSTQQRGRIALIKSGSGKIFGSCRIADCVGPLPLESLKAAAEKHQIPLEQLDALPYPKTYAWVLADVREMREPLTYAHPSGAVIWVTLTQANVPEFQALLKETGA